MLSTASTAPHARTADNPYVAYDEDLAARIRELIDGERGVSEKRMFGGLAFFVNGNMAVAASHEGGILLRVEPQATARLLENRHARPLVMRGREMDGWLRVAAEGLATKRDLTRWVRRGVEYARSLPAK
jgi:TfoX/Sxy family transcriptional regulator of competence genes